MSSPTCKDKQCLSYVDNGDGTYSMSVVGGTGGGGGPVTLTDPIEVLTVPERFPGMDSDLSGLTQDIYRYYTDAAKTALALTVTIDYEDDSKCKVIGYTAV